MAGAAHLVERLERRAPDRLDPETVHDLVRVVHPTVPFDGWCLLGLDPVSLHRTFQFCRGGTEGTRELARLEAGTPDVNRYVDLAVAADPAGWLSRAHPQARSSVRLNEYLWPQGISSELRLVLRSRGRVWGALTLFRRGGPDFDGSDAVVLATCAPVLAALARRHAAQRSEPREVPGDGLVLLDEHDAVVATAGSAAVWLDDLVPGGEDTVGPDDVTRVLYDTAHAARAGCRATVTRRTASGRWLTVSASVVDEEGGVGIQLRAATARERLAVLAPSAGLTAREQDVLEQLTRGLATKALARALGIGAWTVEDHLGSIYRKLGVRGRDEIAALLVDLDMTR